LEQRTRNRGQDWTWNEIDGKRDHLPLDKPKEKRRYGSIEMIPCTLHHRTTPLHCHMHPRPQHHLLLPRKCGRDLEDDGVHILAKIAHFLTRPVPFFPPPMCSTIKVDTYPLLQQKQQQSYTHRGQRQRAPKVGTRADEIIGLFLLFLPHPQLFPHADTISVLPS